MYSQNNEEEIILNYFKDKTAKFIDIGAYDVFRLSNTRALVEKGWQGVLVEADPINYKSIAEFYKDDLNINVLNFAVGNSNEDLEFFSSGGDAVSTSVPEHVEKWKDAGVKFESTMVKQVHVSDFIDAFGHDVKFISIDTEATNMTIFNAVPDWFWQQIDMLCIEHDNCIVEIVSKLAPFGLTKTLLINAENLILAR